MVIIYRFEDFKAKNQLQGNTMRKVILVALGLLLSLSTTQAQGFGTMMHFDGKLAYGELQSVIYTLGLTLEQQEKLQTIAQDKAIAAMTANQTFIQGEMPQAAIAQRLEKLKTAFANKTFDKDLFVQTKTDETNEMVAMIASDAQANATRNANAIEDLLSVLTNAQKTTFFANVQALQAPTLTAGKPAFLGTLADEIASTISLDDLETGALPEALQGMEIKSYAPSIR